MMKLWIAPVTALVVAFAPLAQAQEKSAGTGFVQQALKSGEEDVALAKLAAEKSQSSDLKQFAQMLVSHHTGVNEQLRLLAQRNGAATAPRSGTESSPPEAAPGAAPSSAKAQELGKLSGAEFDKSFLAAIVEGHEKSVELYTAESERGASPPTKKLAGETLPKIKEHLQQAKSLQQQVMEKKSQ
jgi:putative membrane protein